MDYREQIEAAIEAEVQRRVEGIRTAMLGRMADALAGPTLSLDKVKPVDIREVVPPRAPTPVHAPPAGIGVGTRVMVRQGRGRVEGTVTELEGQEAVVDAANGKTYRREIGSLEIVQ